MTLLRLANNPMSRILSRELRGVSKKAREQFIERISDQSPVTVQTSDQSQVTLQTITNSSHIEGSSKSYRTFRQQVKKLKNRSSCQLVTTDNQSEMVQNAVTMFHHLPYSEQLKLKQTKHEEIIENLRRNKGIRQKVSCRTEDILPSPSTESYRNKDMFSVGHDIQGKVAVGFHVGGRREGVVCVGPESIKIIRDPHKAVASLYREFLSEIQPERISLYQGEERGWNSGNWSEIMVRSNYKGEMMVKVLYFTNDMQYKHYEEEKKLLVEKCLSSGLPISSIFLTEVSPAKQKNTYLLYGEEKFVEKIGDLQMLLGPNTFCQTNPGCAELLLDVVRKGLVVGRNRTLLDLCCGAGMFSLQLSRYFRGGIGLDLEDTRYASENAALNNITNCRYITGRIQSIMPALLSDLRNHSIGVSAVLNPGRSGVHHSVIDSIRQFPLLDNLVYISCQPEDPRVSGNFIRLMSNDSKKTPSKYESKPFTLRSSVALDMFPQTHHCEHVFVFRR